MKIKGEVNIISSAPVKQITVMRRRIYGRDIYELSIKSLLEFVDVLSNENILYHIGNFYFGGDGSFVIDVDETMNNIAELLTDRLSISKRKELFGNDINLKDKDCFMIYFSMCPSYDINAIGNDIIEFIKERYEVIGNELIRKRLLRK